MALFLAFRNLFRNTRRTIAVLLTVALGAGALFSFDGFINGVLTQYRDNTIHAHYGYGQINTKGYRESVSQKPWEQWMHNPLQVQNYLSSLKEVEHVFPRVSFSALLANGESTVSGQGLGIDAEKESKFFHSLSIVEGSTLFNQKDGILLGKGLAKALNVTPNDSVTVTATATDGTFNQITLKVTGVFETGSLDFDRRIFRIQLPQAQKLLKTKAIEMFSLGLYEVSDWEKVAQSVEAAFPALESTSFAVLDKVYYQHSVDWLHAQFHVVQVIILAIILLGIFNTVSSSILERKQEIGNLRANGESVFSIMKLITLEGACLGALGGILGMVISYAALKLFFENGIEMPPGPGLTRKFYVTFSFQWSMVLFSLTLSLIAAIIASILGGLRVARMPIAKALRAY